MNRRLNLIKLLFAGILILLFLVIALIIFQYVSSSVDADNDSALRSSELETIPSSAVVTTETISTVTKAYSDIPLSDVPTDTAGLTAATATFHSVVNTPPSNLNPLDYQRVGDYIVEFDSSLQGVIITDYVGKGGEVIIPSILDGKKVIGIRNSAFRRNENIESLRIPDTVNDIGAFAFFDLKFLSSLIIGSGVTSLPEHAIAYNPQLRFLYLPEGVSELNNAAVHDCPVLTDLQLPKSLVKIDSGNFAGMGSDFRLIVWAGSYGESFAVLNSINCVLENSFNH